MLFSEHVKSDERKVLHSFYFYKIKKENLIYSQFHRHESSNDNISVVIFQFRRVFFSLELSAAALRLRDGVPGVSSEGASDR